MRFFSSLAPYPPGGSAGSSRVAPFPRNESERSVIIRPMICEPGRPGRFLGAAAVAIWAMLGASCASCDAGPEDVPQTFRTPEPPRPYSASDILKKFDAAGGEPYRIGEGDQIMVQVWDRTELSGLQIVGPDGMVTVPQVGSLKISGLTRDEAAKSIRDALARLYTGVSVSLRVEQYVSNRVTVVGRVKNPGVVRFDHPPSLLEAIARSGGLLEGQASLTNLTHCAVIRGRDGLAWLDLRSLMEGRDLSLNLRLRADDLVLVPEDGDLPIYVLGQVTKPGPVRFTRGMSFMDALAQAGGVTRDSLPMNMLLVRPSQNQRIVISQSDLLAPVAGQNVALQQGDIIYVPTNVLADIGYLFEKLNPFGWVFVTSEVRRR